MLANNFMRAFGDFLTTLSAQYIEVPVGSDSMQEME